VSIRLVISIILTLASVALFTVSIMFLQSALQESRDTAYGESSGLLDCLMHMHQSSLNLLHSLVMFSITILVAFTLLLLAYEVIASQKS